MVLNMQAGYSHCFVDPVQSVARGWINFTYVPETTAGVLLQSLLRWAGTYTWQALAVGAENI
jgi:hypothetical protein